MKAIKRYRKAMTKIAKMLDKVFPNPGVLNKDESTPGSFVLTSPEGEEHIEAAKANAEILEALEKNVDKVEPYLSPEHGNYGLPEEQRKEAVERYREHKAKGGILGANKADWVRTTIGISVRRFQEWEKEFPE